MEGSRTRSGWEDSTCRVQELGRFKLGSENWQEELEGSMPLDTPGFKKHDILSSSRLQAQLREVHLEKQLSRLNKLS